MRAIVVGFPKSGTTTITMALERSGLRCAHWDHNGDYVGRLVYDGWFEKGDPFAHLGEIDVLTQMDVLLPVHGLNHWPNLDIALLSWIREAHPDCLFILNARPPAKIADSMIRWRNLQARLKGANIVGLPAGRGGTAAELERWIAAHQAAIRRIFAGAGPFLDLDVAVADAPDRLGAALGIPIRWWGQANANKKVPPAAPDGPPEAGVASPAAAG
jgi:hypothetical protein